MQLHRVKITKASQATYWYADKVGQERVVWCIDPYDPRFQFCVVFEGTHDSRPTNHYIDKEDLEIVETFQGSIKESVTIEVVRDENR